ncbi:hypothetical protein ABN028_02960 [Actinopolymorpha sp. B17G11]|uniref:hypothetical protein n=1 Tax=Actinopolymorpha sp. B17G11 TaxID=3160861 RepID=UPI0032E43A9C
MTAHIEGPSGGGVEGHLDRPQVRSLTPGPTGGDTTRRRVLRMATTGVLGVPVGLATGLLAGCTEEGSRAGGPLAGTRSARPSPSRDPDVPILRAAVDAEERLLETYAAVVARHGGLAERLAPFVQRHEQHLAALRTAASPTAAPAAPAGSTRPNGDAGRAAPATPGAALAALIDAEQGAAADRNTDLRASRGGEHARLLASIAACEATHAGQLAGADA